LGLTAGEKATLYIPIVLKDQYKVAAADNIYYPTNYDDGTDYGADLTFTDPYGVTDTDTIQTPLLPWPIGYLPGGVEQTTPPNPSVPGNTVTEQPAGSYVETDPDGKVKGVWEWNEEENLWEFTPAGGEGGGDNEIPETGDQTQVFFLLGAMVSAICSGALVLNLKLKREKS
jgi:hypothetical protein